VPQQQACTALDVACTANRFPRASHCATSDLLLKHLDITVVTYKRRQMKHLKHVSETLAKTLEKDLKTIVNICNIQIKHLQQTYRDRTS
jgi:hypothetical protein